MRAIALLAPRVVSLVILLSATASQAQCHGYASHAGCTHCMSTAQPVLTGSSVYPTTMTVPTVSGYGSGGYGTSGFDPYPAVALQQQLLMQQQATANAEADRSYRQAQADYARLSAANTALEQGNIATAARMYYALSRSKKLNQYTQAAAAQLQTLTADAQRKLAAIVAQLKGTTG